jgi:hypothetical protein
LWLPQPLSPLSPSLCCADYFHGAIPTKLPNPFFLTPPPVLISKQLHLHTWCPLRGQDGEQRSLILRSMARKTSPEKTPSTWSTQTYNERHHKIAAWPAAEVRTDMSSIHTWWWPARGLIRCFGDVLIVWDELDLHVLCWVDTLHIIAGIWSSHERFRH